MWLKNRGLGFKLTVIYAVSVMIIVTGVIMYLEYGNYKNERRHAFLQMELGYGYLNSEIPEEVDHETVRKLYEDPLFTVDAGDIDERLARFEPMYDAAEEGGVGIGITMDDPVTIDHERFYTVRYDITYLASDRHEQVSITLPESHFPRTIAAFDGVHDRINRLYYLPIYGYDSPVMVVSMDVNTFPIRDWKKEVINDIFIALPVILVAISVFGLAIALLTTWPLRRITAVIERLSHSNLAQRVEVKSGDEIGRLARSFNTMADRLEEAFTQQKRFVSDAAHELRTPLASMKTNITRTMSSEKLSPADRELLESLSGRVEHMENLVNDLLFLSRIDEGKFQPAQTELNLSEVLNEAEESFRCLFEEKGIRFSSSIEPELYVRGERGPALRVISNLLDNAAKHTPFGGEVTLEAHGAEVITIEVSDTGPGIATADLPHVFDRFYKAMGTAGLNDGYGLGLAICRSIVAAMGGSISVKSGPDKGSTFVIELPHINGDRAAHSG